MMILSFGQKFPSALHQIKRCNVLVIGNTGVGKSTLISSLFNIHISDSVTKEISKNPYTNKRSSIAVYDTPGLEKDKKQRDKVKKEIDNFIKQQNQKEPEDQIHAVWYCINSQVTRQSDIDSQWIAALAKNLPVIGVITRAIGSEKKWLEPYLESNFNIQCVVSVIAKPEDTLNGEIASQGLPNLLSATENLLQNIAKKAIQNAVNAKANKAYAWCRDGSAKVLASQLVPISLLKTPATSLFQTWMLTEISKTFGYQFDQKQIGELCTVGIAIGGIDSLIEESLKNLPFNYDNIQTVKDVLSCFATTIQDAAGAFPFQEQLVGIITEIANLNIVNSLPILSYINAITTTLTTAFLGIAYTESLKRYKQAEYEGQTMPQLKEILAEEIKLLISLLTQSVRVSQINGFTN